MATRCGWGPLHRGDRAGAAGALLRSSPVRVPRAGCRLLLNPDDAAGQGASACDESQEIDAARGLAPALDLSVPDRRVIPGREVDPIERDGDALSEHVIDL